MGNTPSNRRVTVVNDDVVGVVQVSESVARRLRGLPEKPLTDSDRSSPQEPQISQPTPDISHRPPSYIPFAPPEPYSSTLEQRQKYHEEFKKAEKSWNNRIDELERQNRLLYETANKQFVAVVKEIEENHIKNSYAPVCPDLERQAMKCYEANSKYPLNCSREVNSFMECVDKVRFTALSK